MSFVLELQGLKLPEQGEPSVMPDSWSFCSTFSVAACGGSQQ
jgi:hypothetical protein